MPESAARTGATPALFVAFTRREITAVRRAVARHATGAGLRGERLHDFVLAVNEIVTNAVMHGGGHGELRLWRHGHTMGCEVIDTGPGGVAHAEAHHDLPAADGGGRGLRLARLLVDGLDVTESAAGTAVRLITALPATA